MFISKKSVISIDYICYIILYIKLINSYLGSFSILNKLIFPRIKVSSTEFDTPSTHPTYDIPVVVFLSECLYILVLYATVPSHLYSNASPIRISLKSSTTS